MWYRIKQWFKTLKGNKNYVLDTYEICSSESVRFATKRVLDTDLSSLTNEQQQTWLKYVNLLEKQIKLHKNRAISSVFMP